ncbi:MAG: nucleotidyltransferase domain-containing protein [Gaiellaceae bacterium]
MGYHGPRHHQVPPLSIVRTTRLGRGSHRSASCGTADPTVYPDLNALLRDFVAEVSRILAGNFCGAYLQGSFALGDADVHSDVDFIVVTREEVGAEPAAALQAMHERIFARDVPWAQHLEGSYVPKSSLRTVDPSRAPYLYLDNGATELTRDNHCNTAVVR